MHVECSAKVVFLLSAFGQQLDQVVHTQTHVPFFITKQRNLVPAKVDYALWLGSNHKLGKK